MRQLALAAALLGASCLAPLDRRPPDRAFAASFDALQVAARRAQVTSGPLFTGWARAEIVPPAGAPLAGYGSRAGEPHQGVHDRTWAKAIAVRAGDEAPVVFLALDLLLVDPESAVAISARVAELLPRERLIFTASHTHGGLGGYARGLPWSLVLGAHDAAAEEAVRSAAERAIRGAISALAPGELSWGEIEAPGLNTNRVRRAGAPTDPIAAVLYAAQSAGSKPRREAVMVWFAAHATTVSDLDPRLTADYPGVLQAALESRGLELAAFAAGAVGSMAPRAGWSEHPGARWTGENLARAIEQALPMLRSRTISRGAISALRSEVRLPRRQWRVGEELVVPEWITAALLPKTAHVQAVSWGSATLVALPVELSGEIAARLRARARARGTLLAISVFGGEYAGYVVPRSAYDLPEEEKGELADYESRFMSFYGPWMGDLMAAAAWRTAKAAEHLARRADPAAGPRTPLIRVPAAQDPPPEAPRPED